MVTTIPPRRRTLIATILVVVALGVVGCSRGAQSDVPQTGTTPSVEATPGTTGTVDASGTPGSGATAQPLDDSEAAAIEKELRAIEKELEGLDLPSDDDFKGLE